MFADLNCMARAGEESDHGSVSNGGVGIEDGERKGKAGAERRLGPQRQWRQFFCGFMWEGH